MTANAIGNIITAVAVFEIHIERNVAENINPNKIEFAVPPNIEIILRAIRLCNPQFSIAIASINPPINRKITEFMYEPEISEPDKTPRSGKKTNGTKDVAAIGKASVIHQIAIRTATAATLPTFGFSGSGLKKIRIMRKDINPTTKPIFCILCIKNCLVNKIISLRNQFFNAGRFM